MMLVRGEGKRKRANPLNGFPHVFGIQLKQEYCKKKIKISNLNLEEVPSFAFP